MYLEGPIVARYMKISNWKSIRNYELLQDGYGYRAIETIYDEVLNYYGIASLSLTAALFPEFHHWKKDENHSWYANNIWAKCDYGEPLKPQCLDPIHPNLLGHRRFTELITTALHLIYMHSGQKLTSAAPMRDLNSQKPIHLLPALMFLNLKEAKAMQSKVKMSTDLMFFQKAFENTVMLNVGWRWYADSKQKYGWITNHNTNTTFESKSNTSIITFLITVGSSAEVHVHFLKSYTPEWGKAMVTTTCSKNINGSSVLFDAKWYNHASLEQGEVISNLYPGRCNITFSIQQDHVNKKFKIISIYSY